MQWFRDRRVRGRPPHPDVLTPAEWRVLEHVREGLPNAEIAVRLGLAVPTVKTHVSSMLAKLELRDRSELAAWDGEPAEASRGALGRFGLGAPFGWLREAAPIARIAGVGGLAIAGAVAVWLGVATASGGSDGSNGAVATPVPTEVMQATPTPEATAARPDRITTIGIVEAGSGAYTEVHRGPPARVHHRQPLAPDGTGFWVGHPDADRAVRYGFDGRSADQAGNWLGVVESPTGRIRAYNETDGDDLIAIVETDRARFELDAHVWSLFFSPDERYLAYLQWEEGRESLRLMLLDLERGVAHELAGEIGPSEADGGPLPIWSPSGRYIAFRDNGAWPPVDNERPGAGDFMVEVETGVIRELGGAPWLLGWVDGTDVIAVQPRTRIDRDDGTHSVRPDPVVMFVEAASGEVVRSIDLAVDGGAYFDPSGTVIVQHEGDERTLALDLASGDVLAEWEGRAGVRWTTNGPVAVIRAGDDRVSAEGCRGALVHHPSLRAPHCIGRVLSAVASPAGDVFAAARDAGGRSPNRDWDIILFDVETGTETMVARVTGDYPGLTWNKDGTHVIVHAHPRP